MCDPRTTDVLTRPTFYSSERPPRVKPEMISERSGISIDRVRATLCARRHRGDRSATLPLQGDIGLIGC